MLRSVLSLLNASVLLKSLGLSGLFAIVFAESGLLIGFFLPGDSLIFTAGLFAAEGYLSLAWVIIGIVVFAALGDSVGYAFGKKVGPKIFVKDNSFFFKKENITRSHAFFEKHGGASLILARFTPVVRTFVPVLAGVGGMNYKKFFFYNCIGALIWGASLPLLGYFLGKVVPSIDHYILPIVLLIIIISIIPSLIGLYKNKTHS